MQPSKRIFLGTVYLEIKNPTLALLPSANLDFHPDVFRSAMNVTFQYHRPKAIFEVKEVPGVIIFDYRQNIAKLAAEAFESKNEALWAKSLKKPVIVEINRFADATYIFIGHVGINTKKKDVKHKLEIKVKEKDKVPSQKFIFLEGGSHSRKTISYIALYETK